MRCGYGEKEKKNDSRWGSLFWVGLGGGSGLGEGAGKETGYPGKMGGNSEIYYITLIDTPFYLDNQNFQSTTPILPFPPQIPPPSPSPSLSHSRKLRPDRNANPENPECGKCECDRGPEFFPREEGKLTRGAHIVTTGELGAGLEREYG